MNETPGYIESAISGTPYDGLNITLIESGINTTAKLTSKEDTPLIIKLPTFTSNSEFESEVVIQKTLFEQSYPTPEVVFDGTHLYPKFMVMPFYEYEQLEVTSMTDEQLFKTGKLAGELSKTTQSFKKFKRSGAIRVNGELNPEFETVKQAMANFTTRLKQRIETELARDIYDTITSFGFPEELAEYKLVIVDMDNTPRNILYDETTDDYMCIDWGDVKVLPWPVQQVVTEFYVSHMFTDNDVREHNMALVREGFETEYGDSVNPESRVYQYIYLVLLLRKCHGLPYWYRDDDEELQAQRELLHEELEAVSI